MEYRNYFLLEKLAFNKVCDNTVKSSTSSNAINNIFVPINKHCLFTLRIIININNCSFIYLLFFLFIKDEPIVIEIKKK